MTTMSIRIMIGQLKLEDCGYKALISFQTESQSWNNIASRNGGKHMIVKIEDGHLLKFFEFNTEAEAALFKLSHL